MGRRELVERELDDPDAEVPRPGRRKKVRTVTVTVDLRESSIAQMHARGQIDDAQKVAADRFRAVYERAGLGGVRAIDFTRERVDQSRPGDQVPQTRLDAARQLNELARELGKIGFPVCVLVCGDRHSIRETASRMLGRPPTSREQDYYGKLLRDHLDLLCAFWGYKDPRTLR